VIGGVNESSSRLLVKILTGIENIKETQTIHGKILQRLLTQSQHSESTATMDMPEDLKFPLTTADEASALEARLQDQTTMKCLVSCWTLAHMLC
jgi:hypothetical protein